MFVIGHRGASAYAPENTFAAFDLAVAQGVDAVETDIRASKDGVLCLMHDPTVDRTTDGQGAIGDLTANEIQTLDAGSWFAPQFVGQRVPTLDAFLQRYSARLPLLLEIKVPGTEASILDLALQHQARATYVSFHVPSLQQILRLDAQAQVGVISAEMSEDLIRRARDLGAREVIVLGSAITPQLVDLAHRLGLAVWAWGIPDEKQLLHLASVGVDGCAVDWPAMALRALGRA